jgi:SAM-dependent methyltransferase
LTNLKYLLPKPLRRWLNHRRRAAGRGLLVFDRVTDWSALRNVRPHRQRFGIDRGEPIDRFYIERFLATHQELICGRVAEIGDGNYTRRFGGRQVERSDVLDINEKNDQRTMTIDLTQTGSAPEEVFDCIVCTQTLFEICDCVAVIRTFKKMLRPGGVALVTVPGICQSVRGPMLGGAGNDWWRFTARSASKVFGEAFSDANVTVHTYGNVLTATALLHGLVQEELTQAELEYHDPDYEVIIGIKAAKPKSGQVKTNDP